MTSNEAMQAFVERRSKQPKLVATNRDEIGDLVRAFNTMLEGFNIATTKSILR
ncbi:HAMP domain-containing protein [Vibrio lentus]|nr:HAMP domain-containing protein [Vibrio lentus]